MVYWQEPVARALVVLRMVQEGVDAIVLWLVEEGVDASEVTEYATNVATDASKDDLQKRGARGPLPSSDVFGVAQWSVV